MIRCWHLICRWHHIQWIDIRIVRRSRSCRHGTFTGIDDWLFFLKMRTLINRTFDIRMLNIHWCFNSFIGSLTSRNRRCLSTHIDDRNELSRRMNELAMYSALHDQHFIGRSIQPMTFIPNTSIEGHPPCHYSFNF